MVALRCEICGGELRRRSDGDFQCVSCGVVYSIEQLRSRMSQSSASNPPPQRQHGNQSSGEQILFQTTIGWLRHRPIKFTNLGIEWEGKKYLYSRVTGYMYFIVNKILKNRGYDPFPIHYDTDFNVVLVVEGESEQVQIGLDNKRDFEAALKVLREHCFNPLLNNIFYRVATGESVPVAKDILDRDLIITPGGLLYQYEDFHFFSENEEKQVMLNWADRGKTWTAYMGEGYWHEGEYRFDQLAPKQENIFWVKDISINFEVLYSIVEYVWANKIRRIGQ